MYLSRTVILCAALIAGVLFGLFPPWEYTTDLTVKGVTDRSERPAGYAFIGTPPEPAPNTFPSQALKKMGIGIKLDTSRLSLQYTVLVLVVSALICGLKQRGNKFTEGIVKSSRDTVAECTPTQAYPSPALTVPASAKACGVRLRPGNSVNKPVRRPLIHFRPLTPQDSRWAVVALLGVAIFNSLVLNPLTPDFGTAAGWGSITGYILGTFALCAAGGSLVATLIWLVCRRNSTAAVAGFISGTFAIEVVLAIGCLRMGHETSQSLSVPLTPRQQTAHLSWP